MKATPSAARRFDLDWLRIIALGLLLLYHVGMYYVSWDWHIKSQNASSAIEPLMRLTSPWRLLLLFVVSGAVLGLWMQSHSAAEMAIERSRRLLPPLLFAMLVVVVPQSYFEVQHKYGSTLGYFEFWQRYLAGDKRFCAPTGKCLTLPTWNHMWFVVYLWVYALLVALVMWIRPALISNWAQRLVLAAQNDAVGVLVVLPMAYLALCRLLLLDAFPVTHNLVHDGYNHSVSLFAFGFGLLAVSHSHLCERVARWRKALAFVWFITWAALVLYFHFAATAPSVPTALRLTQRVVWAINQWSAVMAALGFAFVHLQKDSAVRRWLSDAVFPVYLFHQTLIIVLAVVLRAAQWPPAVEAPLLVLLTLALSVALYVALRKVPGLRAWIGVARRT